VTASPQRERRDPPADRDDLAGVARHPAKIVAHFAADATISVG
jgi:hypothetical protein